MFEHVSTATWVVILAFASLLLVGLGIEWARKVIGRVEAIEARLDLITEVLGECVRDIQDMDADGHLAAYAYADEGEEDGDQEKKED